MQLITDPGDIQKISLKLRSKGLTIGLVPTMGWLHEGHLSLLRLARQHADIVICTLFVNPLQFGPNEDFDCYPYDLNRDRKLAENTGVDYLYAPVKEAMYAKEFATIVHVAGVTEGLCGGDRPGHFDGVATVVAKLFNQTQPDLAIFGEKDFQQLAVIRRMVNDLDFPIEIIGHPIVREASGLALSSRNKYLKVDEIEPALSLFKGIQHAKEMVGNGAEDCEAIISAVQNGISKCEECSIEYVEIVDADTLQPSSKITDNTVILLAVKINQRIRLLDNSILSN